MERVRVVVRVRPSSSAKAAAAAAAAAGTPAAPPPCDVVVAAGRTVRVMGSDSTKRCFEFDGVLDARATQAEAYVMAAKPVVARVLDGFNSTIMAYGQTGSGKTYTLGNPSGDATAFGQSVLGRCAGELFEALSEEADRVTVTYVEVYNEAVYDLLSPEDEPLAPLSVLDDAKGQVVVRNVLEREVRTVEAVASLLRAGGTRRRVGATAMNAESSRSHAICTIRVTRLDGRDGKLSVVDLAGSERARKTGAQGDRLAEGIQINKGLLVLGQVISALASREDHAPFRDSKLTRLLRDSLGGTATTVMVACVAPEHDHRDETTNTLRYAARARNVSNVTVRHVVAAADDNDDVSGAVAALRLENAELKRELRAAYERLAATPEPPDDDDDDDDDDDRGGGSHQQQQQQQQQQHHASRYHHQKDELGEDPMMSFSEDDDEPRRFTEESWGHSEEEESPTLRAKVAEAVRTLEEELDYLERARDEVAAELKQKQAALSTTTAPAEKRKEIEALRKELAARSNKLNAKARELEAARADRDRLRTEMVEARAKRVELEKRLRGEAAARAKGAREAEIAVRRATRETEKSKAALVKLERVHELQKAALRRERDETSKRAASERRRKLLDDAAGRARRDKVLARQQHQLNAQHQDDRARWGGDTTLDARLEANVSDDVARALKTRASDVPKIHLPPLSAADARLALRWYHAEIVRLRTAAQRAVRPRLSSSRPRRRAQQKPPARDNDSESSWVEEEEEEVVDDTTYRRTSKPKSKPKKRENADEIDGMTVAELKNALRDVGLKLGGRKSELVARLREHRQASKVVVVAAYDCASECDGELGFLRGDRIAVAEQSDDGWWKGVLERTGETGLFPANYVVLLERGELPSEQPAADDNGASAANDENDPGPLFHDEPPPAVTPVAERDDQSSDAPTSDKNARAPLVDLVQIDPQFA
ncbi:hypothetical protein CTAYLR_008230 [Chrysophaeum taylorii]|uniref:Kinesin-like protein n=1 Tax=Chrysophaeum taylorii TaxID=2483200 RepID=A0AAD7UK75_9STRA|nr:hypothetical protein CTAYLR_008230 [Chrysophaeum taylorii]